MRKKFLAQLLEQMAPLTTDQEGRLHGGFCSLNACGDCDLNTNANCDCNSDCPPPGEEGEKRTNANCDCPSSGKSGEKRTNANCECPGKSGKSPKWRTNTNCDCGCVMPNNNDTLSFKF